MTESANAGPSEAAILAVDRPHPSLWTYYAVSLLAFPPLFPILILPRYFRYHTLRYGSQIQKTKNQARAAEMQRLAAHTATWVLPVFEILEAGAVLLFLLQLPVTFAGFV